MKRFLILLFCIFLDVMIAEEKHSTVSPNEAYRNGDYVLSARLYKKKLYSAEDMFSKIAALDSLYIVFYVMQPNEAIRELETIFKEYPYEEETLLSAYAEAFIRQGDYTRAKKAVDKALSVSQDREYLYEKLVTNGLEKMENSSQKKIITEDVYPKFVEKLYNKSLKYYKTWKQTKKPYLYHKALFYIDSAITIEPNSSEFWFLKGMILSETKTQLQLELALTSFLQTIIINPKDEKAQLFVAQTLFELGRYEEAIVRYKYIFKTYKKDAMNYVVLYPFAVSYMALNRQQELLKYIDEVLEGYDENNTDIWIIWAVIHKNSGNTKHAIEILQWLIDMGKDDEKTDYLKFLIKKYERGAK